MSNPSTQTHHCRMQEATERVLSSYWNWFQFLLVGITVQAERQTSENLQIVIIYLFYN